MAHKGKGFMVKGTSHESKAEHKRAGKKSHKGSRRKRSSRKR